MSISILGPGATGSENMQSQLQVAPPQLPPSVRPRKVFDTYWGFAAERQEIFFRRMAGAAPPWTADPILREFKFTNAYRASDRVSQARAQHQQIAALWVLLCSERSRLGEFPA